MHRVYGVRPYRAAGMPVHRSHAKALLRSLFVGGGGGINTPSVGGFGSHAQQQQQQQQRFGLFNAPLSSSSYSRPYGNGLDQAPAPLLALLESKASHVLEQ